MKTTSRAIIALCVLAVPLLPVPPFWVTLATYIGLASIVALGLVLLTGIGGMTSLGQAAFVGIGAYSTAYATTRWGLSPWFGLMIGLLLTAAAATALGALTTRLSGHFLPLGTLAWGLSLYFLFGNLEFLGKYDGITGIPSISVFGFGLDGGRSMYTLVWVAALGCMLVCGNILRSRVGRAMRALRGHAAMAEAMGVNTARLRTLVFVIAALYAGLAGWLYAHLQHAVNPTPFGVNASIEYLLMAVLGGSAHIQGAVIGAAIVAVLKDQLQNLLPLVFGQGGNYEIVVFGLLLVVLLQRSREGVWPHIAARLTAPILPNIEGAADLKQPKRSTPPQQPLLKVANVKKSFGGLAAVGGVSLEVRSAEIVALIGPNGAGKSTLFNLITGVVEPDAGEISFWAEGRQFIHGHLARDISSLGIARTFQHVRLVPAMSVLENVALGAHLRIGQRDFVATAVAALGLNTDEERSILADAHRQLERVGLAELQDRPAGTLALGQQRIVEIARALCASPSLLLLDEPAAGLRAGEKDALATLLRALKAEGLSVLVVEHDMQFVMKLADRVVAMQFGRNIAEGTPAAIQTHPLVLEAYLGTPGQASSRRRRSRHEPASISVV